MMKPSLSLVAAATWLPLLAAAAYQDAFMVEFSETSQLNSYSLNTLVKQDLLADHRLDCNATTRYNFDDPDLFLGCSFAITCTTDVWSRATVLESLLSIDGVQKAWPVTEIDPIEGEDDIGEAPEISTEGTNTNGSTGALEARSLSAGVIRTRQAGPEGPAIQASHLATNVDELHALGLTGKGVRIAVIDSGFDLTIPGLSQTKVVYTLNVAPGLESSDVSNPCSSHGTSVLGVLGAKGDEGRYGVLGVAPDATYELIRASRDCVSGPLKDTLIQAFLVAAYRKVDAITMSFGGDRMFPEAPLGLVIKRVIEKKGIYVTVSAGNAGTGVMTTDASGVDDKVSLVGSTDNHITPYLSWNGNWTTGDGTREGDFRFNPSLKFDLAPDNRLHMWSPNMVLDVPLQPDCQPIPDPEDLPEFPEDLENTVLVIAYGQCWKGKRKPTDLFGIRNIVYYEPRHWGVANGPAYAHDKHPKTKFAATMSYGVARGLLDAFWSNNGVDLHFTTDPAKAEIKLDENVNYETGNLVSWFSSWGPTLTGASAPTHLAPGGNILTTFPARLGGYGVSKGTSLSAPFAAGVAALVRQRHRTYTPSDIQAVISTTAHPLMKYDKKGRSLKYLFPVFQQGGGLVDAWRAVHCETVLSTAHLSFNDTRNRPASLPFSIKNTADRPVTYTMGHIGAASGWILSGIANYELSGAEAPVPKYATLSFDPPSVTVQPGESAEVSVAITRNAELPGPARRIPYFGGYVDIKADANPPLAVKSLTLPYTGFGASLSGIPIINREKTFQMQFNMATQEVLPVRGGRLYQCWIDEGDPVPATFKDARYPGIRIELFMSTRNLTIDLVDATTKQSVLVVYQSTSAKQWGPGKDWYWDGTEDKDKRLPEGSYHWRVSALRLNSDPAEAHSYEFYMSATWRLEYVDLGCCGIS